MELKKTWGKKNIILALATCLILFTLHIPFLESDPEVHLSIGRDANTDEGLYSYQVRNFINHGDLTLHSSDCLVKTPLFGLILFPALEIFGTKLIVARLCVLILVVCACFIIFFQNEFYARLGFSALIFIFTEYYIFHYFHYSMADTLATVSIFLGIIFLIKPYSDDKKFKGAFLPAVFISLAYFIKIQYLYVLLLIPLILGVQILLNESDRKGLLGKLVYSSVFLVSFLFIYFVSWYWPNADFFSYVLSEQTSKRFPDSGFFMNQVNNNFRFMLLNDYLRIYSYVFVLLGLFGIYRFFKTNSSLYRNTFIGLSLWILLELHKLSMTYLPSRYLISLVFAMGLMIALIGNELLTIKMQQGGFVLKLIFLMLIATFIFKNVRDYADAYRSRTWSIQEADNYLSGFEFGEKPVIGAWATAIAWESEALTFPVWNDYFNDSATIEMHAPAVIISENDEGDSGGAYKNQGISLVDNADSVRYFNVNHWKLNVYWMKIKK